MKPNDYQDAYEYTDALYESRGDSQLYSETREEAWVMHTIGDFEYIVKTYGPEFVVKHMSVPILNMLTREYNEGVPF